MPIKNYTTVVPVFKSIGAIQEILAKRGASGILLEYADGNGKVTGLAFKIGMGDQTIAFRLPIKYVETRAALLKDGIHRAQNDQDYVARVAWKTIWDWIAAQMAILDLDMVELPQIFLPYAIAPNDKTLYENVKADPRMLLGPGK